MHTGERAMRHQIVEKYIWGLNSEGCVVVGNSKHAKDFRNEDMAVDLTGKQCVVTGANQGIGYACAEALAARYIVTQLSVLPSNLSLHSKLFMWTSFGLVPGECMVSVINSNNRIKEPTHGYQNCHTSQLLIFVGYVKARESLYTRVIIWVDTILYHINTRAILPRYEGSCMLYRPEWYWKQNYHTLLVSKNCEILIIKSRYQTDTCLNLWGI